ncbi:MAG TPA: hypothetical protein VFA63_11620 [Pseudonocardiaceae bacterium]|nr:hypothetical protein [Pseudonocardiaceae bacterium]
MNLRPDITVAAAQLTSEYDVSQELRQLGTLLLGGEIVHRLAAGVYGNGGGLMAVTNRRVLLLSAGPGGQVSKDFPLERLTSVAWLAGPPRAIVISDESTTAELTQVEPVEGRSVVRLIRSLVPLDAYDDGYGDDDHELADLHGNALLTHGGPALVGAGSAGIQAAPSGRFTVQRAAHKAERFNHRPTGQRFAATAGLPNGTAPVTMLADDGVTASDLDRPASFPAPSSSATRVSRHSRMSSDGDTHAAVPGVRTVAGSTLSGEVPVHKLAEESGGQDPELKGNDKGGGRVQDASDAGFEEKVDSGPPAASAPQRSRSDTHPRSPRLNDDHDPLARRKWLWVSRVAAVVAALGTIGGVTLWHHSDPPVVMNPAPAVADSDSLSGPAIPAPRSTTATRSKSAVQSPARWKSSPSPHPARTRTKVVPEPQPTSPAGP